MFDLKAVLPQFLPSAIAWAEQQSEEAARLGRLLRPLETELAATIGVKNPGSVYVAFVDQLPLPAESDLRAAALATGLLGPHMAGLTLGYSIFVVERYMDIRLLSHELRHVHQYEMCGSISNFLPLYLEQIATVGYENAPFEIDARRHEIR